MSHCKEFKLLHVSRSLQKMFFAVLKTAYAIILLFERATLNF